MKSNPLRFILLVVLLASAVSSALSIAICWSLLRRSNGTVDIECDIIKTKELSLVGADGKSYGHIRIKNTFNHLGEAIDGEPELHFYKSGHDKSGIILRLADGGSQILLLGPAEDKYFSASFTSDHFFALRLKCDTEEVAMFFDLAKNTITVKRMGRPDVIFKPL